MQALNVLYNEKSMHCILVEIHDDWSNNLGYRKVKLPNNAVCRRPMDHNAHLNFITKNRSRLYVYWQARSSDGWGAGADLFEILTSKKKPPKHPPQKKKPQNY